MLWLKRDFCTSKKQGNDDVNIRLVYSMRSLGKGQSGAKTFCALINMPPPPVKSAYKKTTHVIAAKMKKITKETITEAANDIRVSFGADEEEIVNCGVSYD